MFDLHEEELPVVHQELERAGVRVLNSLRRVHDQTAHLAANLVRQCERRRLLQQFLVPSLDRALAFAKVHQVAVVVTEHLKLDVTRILEILLDVDVSDAERGFGFALRRAQRGPHLGREPDDAHSSSAAAGNRLDDDGVADVPGDLRRLFFTVDRAIAAWQHRQACLLHGSPGAGLVAHQLDDIRIGSDESNVARLADLSQVGALGEKAVARMNRVGARDFGSADDGRHVQVAVGTPRRPDAHVFVREADMQRVLVGLGVDRHGLDAELAARDDHAQRDLPTIRDQNFLEHQAGLMANNRSPYCTAWPFSTYTLTTVPLISA